MIIRQERFEYLKNSTIGKLYIDNVFLGYTLEDTVRGYGIKVYGHTAIPENREGYPVTTRYSPSFERDMIMLFTEQDGITLKYGGISFKYIYAHGGNKDADTLGCILVAENYDKNLGRIYSSMESKVYGLISKALLRGEEVKWIIANNIQE